MLFGLLFYSLMFIIYAYKLALLFSVFLEVLHFSNIFWYTRPRCSTSSIKHTLDCHHFTAQYCMAAIKSEAVATHYWFT